MKEIPIKKDTKNNYYNECNNISSDNMKLLIGTVNDLIKMIDLRIDLNEEENNCIEIIKSNINEIEKTCIY